MAPMLHTEGVGQIMVPAKFNEQKEVSVLLKRELMNNISVFSLLSLRQFAVIQNLMSLIQFSI